MSTPDMVWYSRGMMPAVLSSLESYESGLEGTVGRALERDLEAVKQWLSEALEGDGDDRDAELARATAAAAGPTTGPDNLRAVPVILPPPPKKRRTGQAVPPGPHKNQGVFALARAHAEATMPARLTPEERARHRLPPDEEDSSSEGEADAGADASSAAAK